MFVSSVSGRISTPMTGAYNASKFALEGLADALRLELAPWGIGVVLVEPAQTDTDMWRDGRRRSSTTSVARPDARAPRALRPPHRGLPQDDPALAEAGRARPTGVAATIERALTARRPRARYVVGTAPRVQAVLAQLTPTPVLDAALRAGSGVPRRISSR